ncbi:MAG: succinate dehydrogenase iron-sulfur subunit [Syntrophorhabdus sp.]
MIRASAYTFKILRSDVACPDIKPRFQTYRVRIVPGLTVLGVLNRIRDEIDGTLSFRSSCMSAVCGSCAMVINGRIDLACRTQVASFGTKTIILEPLPNMEIIKDLVVDMSPFWTMCEKIKPWLIRDTYPEKEINQTGEERARIDQFVNCILCACCYGSCPVIARDPEYLGPAALAKLQRFVLDSRDQRTYHDLAIVDDEHGVWGCDTVLRCIEACPKDVRPTDAIIGLRKKLFINRTKKLFGQRK